VVKAKEAKVKVKAKVRKVRKVRVKVKEVKEVKVKHFRNYEFSNIPARKFHPSVHLTANSVAKDYS
jgi:hypothetical protein